MNLELSTGFGPAEYPPRKLNPVESSMPLIPRAVQGAVGPSPYPERPTFDDVLDLVTGLPLIQEVDFELPFGGAVFRHVRTWSGSPTRYGEIDGGRAFWDWNGAGWTMSENPILLIDSEYYHTGSPKRITFIPDSHHAIPFIYDDIQNKYIAPPWFDAVLTVIGEGPETEFNIWLNRRSVRYSFTLVYAENYYEDPMDCWVLPSYALLTRIEDLYGNAVEYDYCPFRGTSFVDDSQRTICTPHCNEKGQLRRIRLRAAPLQGQVQGEVQWTIFYVHRAFVGDDPSKPGNEELHRQHVLQSIYVYRGDREDVDGCLTIPANEFCVDTIEELDLIDASFLPPEYALPEDWSIQVRYLYPPGLEPDDECQARGAFVDYFFNYANAPRHLRKTTVLRREGPMEEPERLETVYRYIDDYPFPFLAAVFSPIAMSHITEKTGVSANDLLGITLETQLTVDGVDVPLVSLADMAFEYKPPCDHGMHYKEGEEDSSLHEEFCGIEWLGSGVTKSVPRCDTVSGFTDRRPGAVRTGRFETYYYLVLPECYPPQDWTYACYGGTCGGNFNLHPQTARYPYRSPYGPGCADSSWPCYVAEWENQPAIDALKLAVIVDELSDDGVTYNAELHEGMRSRRIVEMNRAGFILRDRTWSFSPDGQGQMVSHVGFVETRAYDAFGRVTAIYSNGYNAPANVGEPGEKDNGLVRVFEYEPNGENGRLGELKASGVKRGDENPTLWDTYVEHWPGDDHPELVKRVVSFPTPVEDYETGIGLETVYDYAFHPVSPCGPDCPPAIKVNSVAAPATVRAAGGAEFHAVDRSNFDEKGRIRWRGVGSLQDPNAPGASGDEFFLTRTDYDDFDRVEAQVLDSPADGAPSDEGFVRLAGHDPLAYATQYAYDGVNRLILTESPNGRKEYRVYLESVEAGVPTLKIRTYKDVTSACEALSPGEIQTYEGGRLVLVEKVKFTSFACPPDGGAAETYNVLATLTPEYDNNGKLVSMAGESQGETLSAAIGYNGFGQVARQQDPAGTITRNTYDDLGRLEKTYRGSKDLHPYWGNCTGECQLDDDLALVEMRYYSDGTDDGSYDGAGVHDAGLLTQVRTFREKLTTQYDDDPNEESIGHVTRHYYDWRMREVMVQRRDEAGAPLTHSVTWLDHQDRVKFQLEYGAAAPTGGADPRALGANCALPDVATLLGSAPLPLSLTENIYNARGQVEEVRAYDVSDTSAPFSFTATRTYYNHLTKPTETLSANAPRQTYTYDALGRQIASATWAGEIELARSQTTYDKDSRPVVSTSWERLHDAAASPPELTTSNSIRSWVYTWYDIAGRVFATANFGTFSGDNAASSVSQFVNTNDPPNYFDANGQPLPAPVAGYVNDRLQTCDGSAWGVETLCSCYEYDEDGRQTGVVQPDGTVTRSDFDGLARLRLTIENAAAVSPEDRRLAAYDYDDKGRLIAMAAVLPGHNGGDVEAYTDINWSALDDTIQITTFLYDAPVLDQSGGGVNVNPAWIKAVHYPLPAPPPSVAGAVLEFAYYMDGSVATREDARGCKFTYSYDELGRLTRTLADDKPWYDPVNQGEPAYAPSPRVHEISYDYTPDGQLSLVTARSDPNNALSIIAQNQYDYDARRNLLWELQSHNAPVDPNNSPKVEYTWSWNGLDPNDPSDTLQFDRLASMVYPARPDGGTTRAVTLDYGDNAGGVDSRASRITSIADNLIGGGSVASYAYAGLSRRIASALGNGATQSFRTGDETGGGYAGLDRFGRVADLHYKDSTQGGGGLTLRRDQYGYDRAGNRLYDRVTQRRPNIANQTWDNVRSWLYAYDGLQRLVDAHMGRLNSTNTAVIDPDNGTVPLRRKMTWNLDNLSNWSGGTVANGSFIHSDDTDNDPAWEVESKIHHQVDAFNRITEVDLNGNLNADTVYDIAGNLVFDQDYFYQYDAWGRLAQVNRMLGMTAADFDGEGRLLGSAAGHVGDLVAHYSYDGLGRLIVKTVLTAPGSSTKQHQHHYYDGVRRVQEQFHTESSGGGGTWTTKREYIHGSDYVDEYILQHHSPAGGVGGSSPVVYMLQDANYNVVATLDGGATAGCGGGTGGNGCGSGGDGSGGGGANEIGVYEQYTHEPYGQLAALDKFITTPPQNPVGHQGLFYDHYCATSPSAPCLQVAHKGLYQNRNRFYHPKLGRFTTPDPNSSALTTLGLLYHGIHLGGHVEPLDLSDIFPDGMSLFGYLRANPNSGVDPGGLFMYLDILGATGGRSELMAQEGDVGATVLQAVGGIAGFVSYRSLMLDDVAGAIANADTVDAIDSALAIYGQYQELQVAMFKARLLKAGVGLAVRGFGAIVGAGWGRRSAAWALAPFERGRDIERQLGANTPSNYPVIDRWAHGVATSIKSMDLTSAAYRSPKAVLRQSKKYVDSVASFNGRKWGGFVIESPQIRSKQLELAIPRGVATGDQRNALRQLQQYGTGRGVQVTIIEM